MKKTPTIISIRVAVFRPEEQLLRRDLIADIDRESAPVVIDLERQEGQDHAPQRKEGEPAEPILTLVRRQATARHAEERRDQDDVGEELQKHDVGRRTSGCRQAP
jgi:hypothetical protein